jgi:septal ring factor EnvC (AmiA/AmiB activator)
MNRTLLLILCDFLLLNLLALTRWEKAEPAQARRPPVPEVAANAASRDDDLVAAMQLALADERGSRSALAEQLQATAATLAEREQNLARLETESVQLGRTLTATRETAAQLTRQVAAATEAATMSKEQLARLQRELEEKRAEAQRQQDAIAALRLGAGRGAGTHRGPDRGGEGGRAGNDSPAGDGRCFPPAGRGRANRA